MSGLSPVLLLASVRCPEASVPGQLRTLQRQLVLPWGASVGAGGSPGAALAARCSSTAAATATGASAVTGAAAAGALSREAFGVGSASRLARAVWRGAGPSASFRGRGTSWRPLLFQLPSTFPAEGLAAVRRASSTAGVASGRTVARHLARRWQMAMPFAVAGQATMAAAAREAPLVAAGIVGASGLAAPIGVMARGSALLASSRRGCAAGAPQLMTSVQVRTVWRDRHGYEHFSGRGDAWSFSSRGRMMYGALFAGTAFGLYYWACREEVPYTGRRHSIMFVSQAMEQLLGEAVFEQLTAVAGAEGRLLPPNHPNVLRVQRLGEQIARVAGDGGGGGQDRHMRGLKWQFAVIEDPQPNAMVVPGGKVIVFSGLLRLLGKNDAELAAVLAHEVGHVLARHQAERMSTLNVWSLFNMLLFFAFGIRLPSAAMYMGILLPYSRIAEEEADLIGLRLMARACFDPMGAPTMLTKLNKMEQKSAAVKIPEFLRTHPLTEHRVKRVEAELPEAYRLYQEAGCAARRNAFGRNVETIFDWLEGEMAAEGARFGFR